MRTMVEGGEVERVARGSRALKRSAAEQLACAYQEERVG